MGLRIYTLALRNLRRSLVRTSLLIIIVAVVNGGIFSFFLLSAGLSKALETGVSKLGADVIVVSEKNGPRSGAILLSGEPSLYYMQSGALEKIRRIEGVRKASGQLFLKPASLACCSDVETFLIAFDPASDFTVNPWLKKNLKKDLKDDEVLSGYALSFFPGDSLHFFSRPFTVAGVMDATGINFFDQSVFMTMEAAYKIAENPKSAAAKELALSRDDMSAVLVQVDAAAPPERVAIKIEYEVPGVKAVLAQDAVNNVKKGLSAVSSVAVVIVLLMWALGLVVLGLSFYMIVNERLREFGLIRTLGARKTHMFRLVVTEAASVSAIGALSGICLTGAIMALMSGPITRGLGLPYLMPSLPGISAAVTLSLVLSVISGVAASLFPAVKAGKMEPYRAARGMDL
ncbi:MAG: ABC transporter permease [Nitrospirae bacterium]|nr:ABC transporter permease [Nitrospirota bacterium]